MLSLPWSAFLFLSASMIGCGWLLDTQKVDIQNDADVVVGVALGTVGRGSVAPHTSGVIEAHEGTKSDIIEIHLEGYPRPFLCQWDEVKDQMPIVVTNKGPNC